MTPTKDLTAEIESMRELHAELAGDPDFWAERISVASRIERLEEELRLLGDQHQIQPDAVVPSLRSSPLPSGVRRDGSWRSSHGFELAFAGAAGVVITLVVTYLISRFSVAPTVPLDLIADMPLRIQTQDDVRSIPTYDSGILIVEPGSTFDRVPKTLVQGGFIASTHDRIGVGRLYSEGEGTWYRAHLDEPDASNPSIVIQVRSGSVRMSGEFCGPISELIINEGEESKFTLDCSGLTQNIRSGLDREQVPDFAKTEGLPEEIAELIDNAIVRRRQGEFREAIDTCEHALDGLSKLDYSQTPGLKEALEDAILVEKSRILEDHALELTEHKDVAGASQKYTAILKIWEKRTWSPEKLVGRAMDELDQE